MIGTGGNYDNNGDTTTTTTITTNNNNRGGSRIFRTWGCKFFLQAHFHCVAF